MLPSIRKSAQLLDSSNLLSTNSAQPRMQSVFKNVASSNQAPCTSIVLVLSDSLSPRDTFSVLGQNIPRIAKNKTSYDIVFTSDSARRHFCATFIKFISSSEGEDSSTTPQASPQTPEQKEKVEQSITLEAERKSKLYKEVGTLVERSFTESNMPLLEEIDLATVSRAYLFAHGYPGVDITRVGNDWYNAAQLVDKLLELNILPNITDIRLTACASADVRKVKGVDSAAIAEATRPQSFWEKLMDGPKDSFLNYFSNALLSKNITNVNITGYSASGVYFDGKNMPITHLRSNTIPAEKVVPRSKAKTTLSFNGKKYAPIEKVTTAVESNDELD